MKISRERICFYSSMYPGESSAARIIDCAERCEVGAVELMSFCDELSTPDIKVAKEIGRRARSKGLTLPCFSVGIDAISNPGASLERLRGYAEICSELEIPYLHHTIALDYKCGRLPDLERQKRFDTGTEIALAVADFCRPLGVRTLVEPQGFVFNGIEAIDKLVRISDERIGVVADVGNTLFYDTDPIDFIRAMRGRLCHSHLKDYTYQPTGEPYETVGGKRIYPTAIGLGDLDFSQIFSTFDEGGYDGFFALEFDLPLGEDDAKRTVKYLTDEVLF